MKNRNDAYWRWAAIGLTVFVLSIGCTPATLEFLVMPWKDNKEAAKMPLTTKNKKKDVTVVILASFANPREARPEFQSVDRELCERLAGALQARFDANKEKIQIVPHYKVRSYLNGRFDTSVLDKREIGGHFGADYVVNLEITSMRLYEGNYRQLFRGKAEISVTVFDMHRDPGEGPTYEDIYHSEYPNAGPIDAGNESVQSFRTAFLNRMARDLSRYFAAFPADERLDMK